MALTIGQIVAVSYPAVLAEKRKPSNQWEQSAFMQEAERQGIFKHEDLGATIEAPLDYQRNPAGVIQATDLQPLSLAKTEVLTSASYGIAEISVPIVWSRKDEVQNPSRVQKVALVGSLIENGLRTHDDIFEQYIFATSTNGLLGLQTHVPQSGQGVDGGIDAAANTFWRNVSNTYVDDTDIEAGMTTTWNSCAKGSGASLVPTLIVSDGPTQALFEGTQQPLQRWGDGKEATVGFKSLKFKMANYVFSQWASTSLFFLHKQSFKVVVSKGNFRERGETEPLPNATGFRCFIYSALQSITDNKSRLGVLHT